MFLERLSDNLAKGVVVLDILDKWYSTKCIECFFVQFVHMGHVWVPQDHVGQCLKISKSVREAYATALPGYGERPVASFAIATLGNDAGLIGVADLARIRG